MYCPTSVECTEHNELKCKVKKNTPGLLSDSNLWQLNGGGGKAGEPLKGEFFFYQSRVLNYKKNITQIICDFKKVSTKGESHVAFQTSEELAGVSFVPLFKKSDAKWSTGKDTAECNSKYPLLCPFTDLRNLFYSYNKSEIYNNNHVIVKVKTPHTTKLVSITVVAK